jgi:hypothetical protein
MKDGKPSYTYNFLGSYRPSARRGCDPFNPMSHLGFRVAADAARWRMVKST